MLTLWGRMTSMNVQKVAWVLAESDLNYEQVDAGGAFGGLDSAEYRKMNPHGRVPTLVDGDLVLWESNAICRHLVRAHGGVLADVCPGWEAQSDMWMDWFLAGPNTSITEVFYQKVRLPTDQRCSEVLAGSLDQLHGYFDVVERALEGRDYLLGDQLSLADIPFGACLHRYFTMDIPRPSQPRIEGYFERLGARAPYRDIVMTSYESLRAPEQPVSGSK